MRTVNKLRILFVITALFVLGCTYFVTDHEKVVMDDLQIFGYMEEQEIPLSFWKGESDGKYYLFLPSMFSKNTNKEYAFRLEYEDKFYKVNVDDVMHRSGDVWTISSEEKEHHIRIRDPLGSAEEEYTFQILCSEKLPAVMITAEDLWEIENPQLVSAQKYVEMGLVQVWNAEGNLVLDEEMEDFKVRGNITRIMDKKPFTFTLNESASILGMDEATKWILLANATDGSYIRNKMILDMADKATEDYVPKAEYVDLFLNGQYRGMYLLTEAAEVGENRLQIDPNDSWFMEIDLDVRAPEQAHSFMTEQGQAIALHAEYAPDLEEQEELQELVKRAERVIYNYEKKDTELSKVIDMDSWAFMWALQEISGNCDVGITSQFFYTKEKSEDAVLYAGPVWDFDATMGNTYIALFRVPNALIASIEETRAEYSVNQNRWMSALYKHEAFQEAVIQKYETVFLSIIEEMLTSGIDSYVDFIDRSAELDALRWHNQRLNWQYVLPENLTIPVEGDYHRYNTIACNVDMVKKFLEQKRDFLNELWIAKTEFDIVEEENTQIVLDSSAYRPGTYALNRICRYRRT